MLLLLTKSLIIYYYKYDDTIHSFKGINVNSFNKIIKLKSILQISNTF